MTESLFSPAWYRVAQLKPRLRGHTRVYRHLYRGEVWYVLQDQAKGQYYRFNPASYQLIGLMNGQRTVQELWEISTERLGDDAPTQDDVVRMLGQLHSADVLLCDVPPDTAELLRRSKKVERSRWQQRLRSPLAIKVPLLDPDRFLASTAGFVRPLFGPFGALLWLAVVVAGMVTAGLHWSELTENVVDRVLSAESLLTLALVYPLVKALHELGHGYATKVWGGEVHEMGVMFLVFMPVPYVDASAASGFRSRTRRVVVGAAGIAVELLLAALAVLSWADLAPGTARSLAYSVILIGGVSTVLFNGNPLLRYDGYYILVDLLEMPNLARRGMQYLGYAVQRHVFGVAQLPPPYAARGERFWFVFYTVASFVYRIFIYSAIVLFLAGKFFAVGLLLAAWAVGSMVVVPAAKGIKFLVSSPTLREKRARAVLVTSGALIAVALVLFLVPLPQRTRAEGVVWPPNEGLVRAGTDGFVDRVVAAPNAVVRPGELLVACRDPLLLANVRVLRARLAELQSRYDAALASDRVQRRIVQEQLADLRAELARAEERVGELELRSPRAGVFVVPNAQDLPDRYVRQGDLLGFVLDLERPTIRVVVPQSRVDLVRRHANQVRARPADRLERVVGAVIMREVPEAEEHLPSAILGSIGGGEIAIDPTERSGTKTFQRMFQFDIELDQALDPLFIGGRVHVRFDHGTEPLAFQWYRSLRQVLLRRFNV